MAAVIKRRHAPRQLSPQREQELLDAARDLFFSQGIHATSMNEIAKRARVSKTTIYRRFKSKSDMFETLIKSTSDQYIERIDQLELDVTNPAESLRQAAQTIMTATTLPEHVNLLRQLIAEIPRNKALKKMVNIGMKNFIPRGLLDFFKMLIKKGLMDHPDSVQAATTFILLCNGGYYPLLGTAGSKKDIQKRLIVDVDMFLRGCRIADPE